MLPEGGDAIDSENDIDPAQALMEDNIGPPIAGQRPSHYF